MASNKIGLESSSSESEQADEEREESESEKEDASVQKMFNSRHNPDINIARLSSSSSDSDNYNDSSNVPYINKADTISQNNINSASESVTPNNVSKVIDGSCVKKFLYYIFIPSKTFQMSLYIVFYCRRLMKRSPVLQKSWPND